MQHYYCIQKRALMWWAGAAMLAGVLACGGASLDRSGLGAPPTESITFTAQPGTIVCPQDEPVRLSWSMPDIEGCADGLVGSCDFPFLCDPPPPACRRVTITGGDLDGSTIFEAEGEVTTTVTETTTFTLGTTGTRLTLTVEVVPEVGEERIWTAEGTCEGGRPIWSSVDLEGVYSGCQRITQICNPGTVDILVADIEVPEAPPVLIPAGACSSEFRQFPSRYRLERVGPGAPDECRSTPGGPTTGGADPSPPDDLRISVQTACARFDEAEMMCPPDPLDLTTTTEPIISVTTTPAPTSPPGEGSGGSSGDPPVIPIPLDLTLTSPTVTPTGEAICTPNTCGDGTCDLTCESAEACPRDCDCFDDGVCSAAEAAKGSCRDCRAGTCGEFCTDSSQCGSGLSCAGGVCWDACTCGGDCGDPTATPASGPDDEPTQDICEDACGNNTCDQACGETPNSCPGDCL